MFAAFSYTYKSQRAYLYLTNKNFTESCNFSLSVQIIEQNHTSISRSNDFSRFYSKDSMGPHQGFVQTTGKVLVNTSCHCS